jgi:hypothetical protein
VFPDGELVLMPVPLVAPVLGAPATVPLLLTDPDVPGLDVDGDAEGLLETPAACIACWLQRSKSARLMVPAAMAATGNRTASVPATRPCVTFIIASLLM